MTFACRTADVPAGEGRTAVVDGVRVAIFHTTTGWHCVDADCTHRGGPLSDGLLADTSVTCPLHQRRFDLLSGEPVGHECPALRVHAIEARGDELHVRLSAEVAALAAVGRDDVEELAA